MLNLKRHYILHRTAVEGCDDVKSTLLLIDWFDDDKEKKSTFLWADLRFIRFHENGGRSVVGSSKSICLSHNT